MLANRAAARPPAFAIDPGVMSTHSGFHSCEPE
jgi:hypothetical protein